jgi:hypothetical protein
VKKASYREEAETSKGQKQLRRKETIWKKKKERKCYRETQGEKTEPTSQKSIILFREETDISLT